MSSPEAVFYTPRRVALTSSGGLLHAAAGQGRTVCGFVLIGSNAHPIGADPTRPRMIECKFCRAKLLEDVPVYAVGEASV